MLPSKGEIEIQEGRLAGERKKKESGQKLHLLHAALALQISPKSARLVGERKKRETHKKC